MKLSIQTGGLSDFIGIEKACRLIREAGFEGVDWGLNYIDSKAFRDKQLPPCIWQKSLEEIQAHFQPELDCIRKSGLEIVQAHGPYPSYVRDFPEYEPYFLQIVQQSTRYAASVGIPYFVVHGASLAPLDANHTPESIRDMNLRMYESLIPILQASDTVVCLEDLFATCKGHIIEGVCCDPDEAVWYIDYLNEKAGKECFGLCMDTGHLNLAGKSHAEFIRKLGHRIKCLHLHDNGGSEDDHLAPYTGTVPWRIVMDTLKEVGYSGDLNFETFAQVWPYQADPEVVPSWLKLLRGMGEVWRQQFPGEAE